jgi:hypothetical protein
VPRFWFMFGTLAALTALVLGGLGMQWQLLDRLARFEARMDVRLETIESRFDDLATSCQASRTGSAMSSAGWTKWRHASRRWRAV